MSSCSLKVSNYKCFGEEPYGFDQIAKVNIIVGRNNTGKSALLDIVELATQEKIKFQDHVKHLGAMPKLLLRVPLDESVVKRIFPESMSGGGIPGRNFWEYGKQYIGMPIEVVLSADSNSARLSKLIDPEGLKPILELQDGLTYAQKLAASIRNPFQNKVFKRIFAERNIEPEADSENLSIQGTGRGATNLIQNFINKTHLDSFTVERELLAQLNIICSPDAVFKDIVCQQPNSGPWEIFLEEEHKGRIALSSTGSGLKTIILVLSYLILLPVIEKKPLSDFIFAFEELENNLHPALLRRLVAYLLTASAEHNFLLFLTTHSNVLIDILNNYEDSQIIHVMHNSKESTAKIAQTYIHARGILDDLDVRASDLLQANGIVWVEGPSDRIYFRRWIELFSDGILVEGLHYQTVFYGGRLLAHLNAKTEESDDGIQLFRVNRNNMVLIDSDKRTAEDDLNNTKKRIIWEIEETGGFAWVTEGREIENYIPVSAFSEVLGKTITSTPYQYGSVFDWMDTVDDSKGQYFIARKPLLAEQVTPHLTKTALSCLFEFETKIIKVVNQIKSWNSM